jgi:hypothetical protein
MVIWFHGTNKTNAESIFKNGFEIGTWFARHLEDALAFGGNHVFEVALDENKVNDPEVSWQLHTLEKIGPELIIAYNVFTLTTLYDNPDLRREVFESNSDGSVSGLAGKIEHHKWSNDA